MRRLSTAYALLLFAACESDPKCQGGDGADGERSLSASVVPVTFRCELHYRQSNEVEAGESPDDPKFQFQTKMLEVPPGADLSERLGQLTFSASQADEPAEGGAFSLRVSTDERFLASWLYQFDLTDPPKNQFASHGFTGLVYLTHPTAGGDYQLFCHADS